MFREWTGTKNLCELKYVIVSRPDPKCQAGDHWGPEDERSESTLSGVSAETRSTAGGAAPARLLR